MESPIVSVIVPCFKQAHYLNEAIRSVLEQTYSNWECIIVNDGSPDHTEEIALKWCEKDKRIKYIFKNNGGLSSARNAGLKIAKGNYIQFLDADDIINSHKMELQVNFLEMNHLVDIVYSSSQYFITDRKNELYPIGKAGQNPTVNLDKSDYDQLLSLLWCNCTTICSTLYRRKVIDKIGYFDEELRSLEDWNFHLRCSLSDLIFHFEKMDGAESFIRIHSNSMMRDEKQMNNALELMFEKVRELMTDERIRKYKFMELPYFVRGSRRESLEEGNYKSIVKKYLKRVLKMGV